jgi:hypothetical protein
VEHRLEEVLLGARVCDGGLLEPGRARLGGRHVALEDLPAFAAEAVQERVAQDGQEPGPAVAARVELVEVPEGPEPCLLDQVLGLGPVVREPERRPVQEIQVHEGDALELAGFATIPDPPEHGFPEVPSTC